MELFHGSWNLFHIYSREGEHISINNSRCFVGQHTVGPVSTGSGPKDR